MKVLIVEDERSMALEMAAFLKKAFYLCDLAHTAKQAGKMMEEHPELYGELSRFYHVDPLSW